MGLDIHACSSVKLYEGPFNEDGTPEDDDEPRLLYNMPPFVGRAPDILNDTYYWVEGDTWFAGMPYSTYNRWRSALARMAGYDSDQDCWEQSAGPFWELINFADNEGCISSSIAAKLADDFERFRPQAEALDMQSVPRFLDTYNAIAAACRHALPEGCVVFT